MNPLQGERWTEDERVPTRRLELGSPDGRQMPGAASPNRFDVGGKDATGACGFTNSSEASERGLILRQFPQNLIHRTLLSITVRNLTDKSERAPDVIECLPCLLDQIPDFIGRHAVCLVNVIS